MKGISQNLSSYLMIFIAVVIFGFSLGFSIKNNKINKVKNEKSPAPTDNIAS